MAEIHRVKNHEINAIFHLFFYLLELYDLNDLCLT